MRVCAEPGCPELSEHGYCPVHRRERRARENRAAYRDWVVKAHKSARWQRMREQQLARQPYCQCPNCAGLKVKATIADHREPHRGDEHKFWHGPLMSLAKYCHDSWKQRIERQHGEQQVSVGLR